MHLFTIITAGAITAGEIIMVGAINMNGAIMVGAVITVGAPVCPPAAKMECMVKTCFSTEKT